MTVRLVGVAACLVGLAGLSFYSARTASGQVDTLREVAQTRGMAGREVRLTSDVLVAQVLPAAFQVRQGRTLMWVSIPPALDEKWERSRQRIAVGDYISLRATYQGDQLEAQDFHVHYGRHVKIWISAAAVILAAWIIISQRRTERRA